VIDYKNIRYPVVILASPRSGSTALANHIHGKLEDVLLFQEPDSILPWFSNFLETAKTTNQYVVKIQTNRLNLYPKEMLDYLIHSSEPYRVCIRRRNKIEQSLSRYIATTRQKWFYQTTDISEDIIPINYAGIKKNIQLLEAEIAKLDSIGITYDTTIWYEDFDFSELDGVKTPKPKNYEELYTAFTNTYNTINE
jgi:LPS sulfotransferase NodH